MNFKIGQSLAFVISIVLIVSGCNDFTGPAQVKPSSREPQGPLPEKGTPILPADFLSPNEGEFSGRKMLINIGTQILAKQAESFANQVPVLKESLTQYCGDLQSNSDVQFSRSQAQADWKRVMMAFHSLEGAPFGPFINRGRLVADNLYAFPYLNACGIDQNVLASSKGTVDMGGLLYNVRGLGAIEYLLFEETLTSKCNMRANPEMRGWNALPTSIKMAHRCDWALRLMGDIQDKANLLKSEWALQEGNFTQNLVNNSIYSIERDAINALTDAMSNVEFLKDVRLGRPLGRHKDCAEGTCPQDVEHRYSGLSLEAAEVHLKSFRSIFFGSTDPNKKAFGFDDLLISSGRKDVLERMTSALDRALASIKMIQKSGTLQSQIEAVDVQQCQASSIENRAVEICAVHADVREVAFRWKTEVLLALSLRAPPSHQGDND